MDVSFVGTIRTPFGDVGLIPQDRNLLQVSSAEPLRFGDARIHLWAMLERICETWGIASVVEPVLQLIDGYSGASSMANDSIAEEVMKSVTSLAGEWAAGHPEAFEYAAAEAFKFDKEGLYRELGTLRESLTCSAQAIDSITSEVTSKDSACLREYSKKMRSMAFEVPAIQKIARTISYPAKAQFQPKEQGQTIDLPHFAPSSAPAPAANSQTRHLRDVTGARKNTKNPVSAVAAVSGSAPSIDQTTLGQVLKNRRKELGLSQRELAVRLGLKAVHIAQLETDSEERPSFKLLGRVADVLGLDKGRLFQLAETRENSPSRVRKAASQPRDKAQVWGAFARDRKLLNRHNVRPQELKVLSQVNLMGKITGSEALLFILDAIRKAGENEEE